MDEALLAKQREAYAVPGADEHPTTEQPAKRKRKELNTFDKVSGTSHRAFSPVKDGCADST